MSVFPTSLDSITDPDPDATLLVEQHALRHKNLSDAIEAIEATVGITGSLNPLSHDSRINSVEVITAALGTAAFEPVASFDATGAAEAVRQELLSRLSIRC